MSRYVILVLLNIPSIVGGYLNAVVSYKTKTINSKQLYYRILLWTTIITGLIFAKTIYDFLFSNDLTRTEPLSLFDVIQITGIVFTLLLASRAYAKVAVLQKNIHQLNQNISILLSNTNGNKTKK